MPSTSHTSYADSVRNEHHKSIEREIVDELSIQIITDAVEEWHAVAVSDSRINAALDFAQILGVEIEVFEWRLVVEITLATVSAQ